MHRPDCVDRRMRPHGASDEPESRLPTLSAACLLVSFRLQPARFEENRSRAGRAWTVAENVWTRPRDGPYLWDACVQRIATLVGPSELDHAASMMHTTGMQVHDLGRLGVLLAALGLGCAEEAIASMRDAASQDVVVDAPDGANSDVSGPCSEQTDAAMVNISMICDGIGRAECQRLGAWGGEGLSTYSLCIPLRDQCIFADRCGSSDLSSCRCGTGAPCRLGEICAASGPGAVPSCVCVASRR
jgi:hypothetical protein